MYGTRRHAPHTTDWPTRSAELAQAIEPEINPTCRGDARRRCVVASSPLPSYQIPDCISLLPLAALDLSVRLFNLLSRAGVTTVGQILEMDLEALFAAKLGEKSIGELIDRVQTLHLLDPVEQVLREKQPAAAPTGRHDNRRRPGRGKLRTAAPEKLRIAAGAQSGFCYKVRVAQLPDALRMTLPRWTRGAIEQDKENKTNRSELPRRAHYCYIQAFAVGEPGELVEWRPDSAGTAPRYYRAAATPDALRSAALIELDPQQAQALLSELVNPATPSPTVRVAPAFFLTSAMRTMIAPGVAFPDAFAVPEHAASRRVSLDQGNQVPIPRRIAGMRIERLPLSEKTLACLQLSGVTTVGALLELEEERLGALLDREGLWELSTAVAAYGLLPTPAGLLPPEHAQSSEPAPICEVFYFYATGTTYDDPERGRLYLVRAALFVDRLDGSRSGPVETIWLTRAQIGQSLLWHRGLEQLEVVELRTQVTMHAVARGATLPHFKGSEDQREERKRQMVEMEERYNRVPLKDPVRSNEQKEIPLELYISNEDLAEAKAHRETETAMILRVVERYIKHPALQPIGSCLSRRLLEDIHYWIGEDQRKRRELPSRTATKISHRGSLVMHKVYVYHKQSIQDRLTGKIEIQDVPEHTGYKVIIGLLTLTGVDDELVVHPRPQQPGECKGPQPLVHRTPNYVPIEGGARVA
jgi:hypothetical protein